MKRRLQRILSILCVLALAIGCVSLAALAEGSEEIRIISVQWDDENDYDAKRPGSVEMSIGDAKVTLNPENNWTAEAAAPAGAEWVYADVAGYTRGVQDADATIVTYTHQVAKTSASGKVVWSDNDNAAAIGSIHETVVGDNGTFLGKAFNMLSLTAQEGLGNE